MSLFLRIQGPGIQPDSGQDIFIIPPGDSLIGRVPRPQDSVAVPPECALPADFVSGQHAKIEYTNTECWITDLDSTHGSTIDGRRLTPHQRTRVTLGDVITIASQFTLTLEEIPEEEEEIEVGPSGEPHQLPARILPPRPYSGEIPPSLSLASLRLLPYLPEVYRDDHMALPARTFNRNGSHQGAASTTYGIESGFWAATQPSQFDDSGSHDNGGSGNGGNLFAGDDFDGHRDWRNQDPTQIAFLSRYLALIESVWLPLEWTVANFDLFFAPLTVPSDFMRWLLTWFDDFYDPSWDDKQLRTMLSIAHRLHARRGTRWALRWVLWIYTGTEPEINDSDDELPPDTFHVRLNVSRDTISADAIHAIIDAYKPAHTFYEILDL